MPHTRRTDEDEQERAEHQPHGDTADREPEERRARRSQKAREEEQARDDVLCVGAVVGGQCRLRWGPTGAYAEGKNTGDHVAVVRADAPQHRVVAVSETASKRYDERTAAEDARLSGEHRATSVADRPDPRSGTNVVVEEDTYPRWCGPEHGAVPGNGPQEPGMGPGRLGEGQGTE